MKAYMEYNKFWDFQLIILHYDVIITKEHGENAYFRSKIGKFHLYSLYSY